MSFKDAILSGLDEYLTALRRTLDGLTAEELRFQASPSSNHITWLVWHMSRVEDNWIMRVSGTDTIWGANDWASKTGVSGEAYAAGNVKTMDEVAGLPDVPIATLLDYYDAVRTRTLAVLESLSDDDMATIYPNSYRGAVTNAWIFGHIIVEESQHLGQIAFIRGMQRGLGG
ncbi:MAG: DinB family protein [Chloroflexi bacterium]|nr:DinB family protein [Chloroflexota bacterium]